MSSFVFVARPLQAAKPFVARIVQRLHREDRALATIACQVVKQLLAQHAMLLLVDKKRFFWQRIAHHRDDIVIAALLMHGGASGGNAKQKLSKGFVYLRVRRQNAK